MNYKNSGTVVIILKAALICAVLFCCIGCNAYLNTLYNGRNAYNEARKLHLTKSRNFPDSMLVTPPQDAVTRYERTVEKSIKVIESFPKKRKWHDDALILMGKAYYYKKDFQKAIRRFIELQTEFPASKYIPESYIFVGMCYIEDGNYDKAEEVINFALSKYPEKDKNQELTMLLVEIAVRREGRSTAILLLEKTLKSAKSVGKRMEIVLRISQLYIDMKQFDKAIPLLKTAPRKKDYPEQSYRLDKNLYVCYRETGKLDQALQLISMMASSRLYSAHEDEIFYEKGIVYKVLEKYDEAIDVFKTLCRDVDSTTIRKDTSTFKSKAFYQLGLIYQLQMKDYEKAAEYYTLAAAGTDTVARPNALRRVTAMKKLDSLRNVKGAADTLREHRLMMIGEIFRFDLEEPDSASKEYLQIYADTSIDRELAAKALTSAAFITKDELRDSVKADSLFRVIIEKYPVSIYAKLAQMELNLPLTVLTRSDSAYIAYKEAEELFYGKNDVKGAIQDFYSIARDYPELDIAPKALYAAAWFSDNVLLKKTTAKTLYEKICELYRSSVYCSTSADIKIKTLRDTLAVLNEARKREESIRASLGRPAVPKATNTAADSLKTDSTANSIRNENDLELDDDVDRSGE
ncbi:MAG: tetratricopeptide repeat protein [Fibrobacter sp.]|nr:tetratricopeptide repeat protein [Fibrobacter sp.]